MTLNVDSFHFKIGDFECVAISDGTYSYAPPKFPPPAKFLFINAPKERVEQVLRQHNLQPEQWKEWKSPYICMIINTGKHLVLVDTGADGIDPNTGKLLQNLQTEGIKPQDIDTVILTHGHPDHIGGNTDGEGKPAFPGARYVMWKDEWDFWTSGQAELKLDKHVKEDILKYARRDLPPIRDQLDLVDNEKEIVPGIYAITAPGHTHGHMALSISSKGEQLLCISDAVLHPIHLEYPEWYAAVDFSPEQVVTTRRKLLERAENEKALTFAFHLPFPGLGYVIRNRDAWQWQPIELSGR